MAGNGLWELSPQQIASCVSTCDGCGGGGPQYGGQCRPHRAMQCGLHAQHFGLSAKKFGREDDSEKRALYSWAIHIVYFLNSPFSFAVGSIDSPFEV